MALILVVEDDELARTTICRILQNAGHQLIHSSNGIEALLLFRRLLPDLVIADLILPELDGLGLIRELRRHHPDARILAVSGGGRQMQADLLSLARDLGAMAALEKPYGVATLLELVALCLDGEHPGSAS